MLNKESLKPLLFDKIKKFYSIKRNFWSFVIITIFIILSCFAELLINSRALIVRYQGKYYFPIYSDMIPGNNLGFGYEYETNYRNLKDRFQKEHNGNFVIMPIVPYNPYESDLRFNLYPPFPPSIKDRHFLGTDNVGRDVLARLVYGFRIAMKFSLLLLVLNYSLGICIGSSMGYFGGKFDILFQRIIEIWSNIPLIYVIIILSSIVVPNFMLLLLIMAFLGWIGITWIIRTVTYKEKEKEYIFAAKSLGASHFRVIFYHIVPNTVSVIVTYVPFAISGGIISLTSLDYLGFGLPAPTPSWGELLSQGWQNMEAWWISTSVIGALILTLMTVTFIGEGIREAFDPKRYMFYE